MIDKRIYDKTPDPSNVSFLERFLPLLSYESLLVLQIVKCDIRLKLSTVGVLSKVQTVVPVLSLQTRNQMWGVETCVHGSFVEGNT